MSPGVFVCVRGYLSATDRVCLMTVGPPLVHRYCSFVCLGSFLTATPHAVCVRSAGYRLPVGLCLDVSRC